MGICDAKHLVLQPIFAGDKIKECRFINRANVQSVQFETPDNCPHIEKMRREGLLPFAVATIDFSGGKQRL